MTDRERLRDGLVIFLNSVARPGCQVDDIEDDRNLIDADIIDSFALIQIISWLEQNYGLNLQELGIDPADLGRIDGILDAIARADG
jgi:acyl carrier protein